MSYNRSAVYFLIAMALALRRPVHYAMKKWRLVAALPFLISGLFAAAPAATDVVLPERLLPQLDAILKNALQQSPRMVNRALDLEIAENNRIEARANLLPSFSASASYLISDDSNKYTYNTPGNSGSTTTSYVVTKTPYYVSLSQPLFYWGERKNNARMGEIQQMITQGQYREGYRALAQELRASYMRLTVQKLSLKRARFNVEFANSRLKQEEERLVKKVISEAEIFTARLNAEQAQIAVERAEFDYSNAKVSFARLAGLGVMADESVPDTIPAITYAAASFDQMLAGFLAQKDPPSTEAATFRHQLEIADLTYANQKTRLKPKLSASFGLSQDEQSNFYGQHVRYTLNSLYGGVSVNWAIFDGFASGAATRSALARRRQMENDYRQLTERLASDAQSQVKLINFSARNMSIYDRYLTSAEGNLKTVQDDFRRGVKSDTEVSVAQLYLQDSEISALNTRIDYLLKIGDFLGTVMNDPVLTNLAEK
jgi:outer membrane protein TolC